MSKKKLLVTGNAEGDLKIEKLNITPKEAFMVMDALLMGISKISGIEYNTLLEDMKQTEEEK